MDIYAESRASRKQPPYDESLAADRQRFEDFKSGFVAGIGEALLQGALLQAKEASPVRPVECMIRSALVVHGRN